MKKLTNAGIVAIALLFVFSSCRKDLVVGAGPVVTQTRSINNFTGVSDRVPGRVNFKIGPAYKVEISAQQNILDVLNTYVANGVLIIDFSDHVRVRENANITINITAPSADHLSVSGTGDMYVEGDLVTGNLNLNSSGTGKIVIQKAAVNGTIAIDISGIGNISIGDGFAVNEDLRISGVGDIDLSNILAQNATTHTSGSGNMKVNLSQSLDVHISGSGTVYYRGTPVITTHISGSGNVQHL